MSYSDPIVPIIVLCAAALCIVATGVVQLVAGDRLAPHFSKYLMMTRMACQFLALVMVIILFSV